MKLLTFLFSFFKRKKYTIEDFNLQEKCYLKFYKSGYDKYTISFYHPLYKRWWTLPEERAGIHERWSLLNHGSFGAYDLNTLSCSLNEVDSYRKKFQTIGDIKDYLDIVAKRYDRFKEEERKQNALPKIITN